MNDFFSRYNVSPVVLADSLVAKADPDYWELTTAKANEVDKATSFGWITRAWR